VKLKMEFRILNQLMEMTQKRAREEVDMFNNSSSMRIHDAPSSRQ